MFGMSRKQPPGPNDEKAVPQTPHAWKWPRRSGKISKYLLLEIFSRSLEKSWKFCNSSPAGNSHVFRVDFTEFFTTGRILGAVPLANQLEIWSCSGTTFSLFFFFFWAVPWISQLEIESRSHHKTFILLLRSYDCFPFLSLSGNKEPFTWNYKFAPFLCNVALFPDIFFYFQLEMRICSVQSIYSFFRNFHLAGKCERLFAFLPRWLLLSIADLLFILCF